MFLNKDSLIKNMSPIISASEPPDQFRAQLDIFVWNRRKLLYDTIQKSVLNFFSTS